MSILAKEDNGGSFIQAFHVPASGETTVISVTTSSSTTPLPSGMYRFLTTSNCMIAEGPLATTSDLQLVAGIPEYFHIRAELSTISTGSATLYVSLC